MAADRFASGVRAVSDGRWEEARGELAAVVERDPENVAALEALATALAGLDDLDRAVELREQAYRLLIERGDARGAARVAMNIVFDVMDLRGMAVGNGWLQRARRLLDDVEISPEHGWLALWEGHFARAFDHDLAAARAKAEEAKRIARAGGVHDLELLAVALEGLIDVTAGNVRDGMRRLDEAAAAAVAGELSDLNAVLATCCFLVHACERVCDWERAAQWGPQMEALAARWRLDSVVAGCQAEHAAMLIGRGEWERAERDLQQALRTLEEKRPLLVHEAIVQLAELRRRQGRLDEAAELFNRAPTMTGSIIGLAAIALERGDALRAAEMIERLQRRPMAEKWVERAVASDILARARLALGDRDAAERATDELRRLASTLDIEMVSALSSAAEGRLAAAASDHPRARRHFEDAIDLYERMSAPWDAALTRIELGSVLRHLGRESFAREELAAARDTLRRLGAVATAERIAALIDGTVPRDKPPLTRRELEILRLVARGMSNKEVAAALALSEHTVHRHVANVLTKLNVPSRAAAVGKASAAGWIA